MCAQRWLSMGESCIEAFLKCLLPRPVKRGKTVAESEHSFVLVKPSQISLLQITHEAPPPPCPCRDHHPCPAGLWRHRRSQKWHESRLQTDAAPPYEREHTSVGHHGEPRCKDSRRFRLIFKKKKKKEKSLSEKWRRDNNTCGCTSEDNGKNNQISCSWEETNCTQGSGRHFHPL